MGVQHHTLDVLHVGVILKSTTIQTDLLTHFGDLLPVILVENIQLEDSFCDVWSTQEIDFEDFGLEVSLVLPVAFEGLEEESSALLEFIELEEDVHYQINLCLWRTSVSVGNHFGQANSCLRVRWHDLSQDCDEVWNMSCLLTIWHDFIKLVCLNQSFDNFVWRARLLVDVERQLWIGQFDEISKLVSHCQLTFFDPVLDQIQFVLGNHWSCELHRFNGIEFCGLKESVEVNQNWSWASSLREVLEDVNGLLVSQKGTWSISGNSGSSCIISSSNLAREELLENFIGSRQVESLGKFEGKSFIVSNMPS